jgi:hypothetical protein
MNRLRLLGAFSGVAFAALVLVALAIPGGTPIPHNQTVVAFYSAHGTATLWKVAIMGLALACFAFFASTFAARMQAPAAVHISAAAIAALFLAAFACFTSLSRTYAGIDVATVPGEAYRAAHAVYDVGVALTLMANFMEAVFVGATAAALIAAPAAWRRLAGIGFGLAVLQTINAALQTLTSADWADAVGAVAFLAFLAWVAVLSVIVVITIRPPR